MTGPWRPRRPRPRAATPARTTAGAHRRRASGRPATAAAAQDDVQRDRRRPSTPAVDRRPPRSHRRPHREDGQEHNRRSRGPVETPEGASTAVTTADHTSVTPEARRGPAASVAAAPRWSASPVPVRSAVVRRAVARPVPIQVIVPDPVGVRRGPVERTAARRTAAGPAIHSGRCAHHGPSMVAPTGPASTTTRSPRTPQGRHAHAHGHRPRPAVPSRRRCRSHHRPASARGPPAIPSARRPGTRPSRFRWRQVRDPGQGWVPTIDAGSPRRVGPGRQGR